jgi:hypothetical protein
LVAVVAGSLEGSGVWASMWKRGCRNASMSELDLSDTRLIWS